jgi:hypothetical protein
MRGDVLADVLAKLDECDAPPEAIAQFRQIVEAAGARHGLLVPLQTQRVDFARQLLRERRPRAEIRDRLMCRFSIGESQAYRDIGVALQIVPNSR